MKSSKNHEEDPRDVAAAMANVIDALGYCPNFVMDGRNLYVIYEGNKLQIDYIGCGAERPDIFPNT